MTGKGAKFGLALIGAGGMGRVWADAIKTVPSVSLRLVVDTDLEKAGRLARQFAGCRVAVSVAGIGSGNENISGAIVAVPHAFLASVSQELLRHGINVLCEKPGGISAAEVKKTMALARRKKLVYAVGFNHRYHAAFIKAREVIAAGRIGRLQFIRARYGFGGRPGYEKEWRFKKNLSGGGELLDQGVHMIDLARSFLGDFAKAQGALGDFFWHGEVEDNAFALLQTRAGQVAAIHVSWSNWKWVHCFEIFGEKGYCVINGLDQRYQGPERLVVGRRARLLDKPPTERTFTFKNELKHSSLGRQLKDFIAAAKSKSSLLANGRDAAAVLKIVETIYRQS